MAFTLNDYLSREVTENALPEALKKLLLAVAETSKAISAEVASAPIAGELGLAGSENIQGEDQKKTRRDQQRNDVPRSVEIRPGYALRHG